MPVRAQIISEIVAGSHVLVVSPHLDDAVLSAHSLLVACAAHAASTTVLTVFTAAPSVPISTDWDRRCGFTDSSQATAARLEEDRAAFAGLGVERRLLGLVDAGYRDRDDEEDPDGRFGEAVSSWVREHASAIVVLPAGAGPDHGAGERASVFRRLRRRLPVPVLGLPGGAPQSSDHRWVTDSAVAAVDTTAPSTPVIVYDDLPYAWLLPGDARAAALARRRSTRAELVELPVDLAAKGARVGAYRSQIPAVLEPWARDLRRHLPATERIWLLPPA